MQSKKSWINEKSDDKVLNKKARKTIYDAEKARARTYNQQLLKEKAEEGSSPTSGASKSGVSSGHSPLLKKQRRSPTEATKPIEIIDSDEGSERLTESK